MLNGTHQGSTGSPAAGAPPAAMVVVGAAADSTHAETAIISGTVLGFAALVAAGAAAFLLFRRRRWAPPSGSAESQRPENVLFEKDIRARGLITPLGPRALPCAGIASALLSYSLANQMVCASALHQVGRELSRGSFATVYAADWNGTAVAVKARALHATLHLRYICSCAPPSHH